MCMEKITEKYDHPSSLITDGWKSFAGSGTKLSFESYSHNGTNAVPMDQWTKADHSHAASGVVTASDGKAYKPGFHVFTDESELAFKKPGLRRVFVRNITCKGRDAGKSAVVAQEIYVPSDPNAWPPQESAAQLAHAGASTKQSLADQLRAIADQLAGGAA